MKRFTTKKAATAYLTSRGFVSYLEDDGDKGYVEHFAHPTQTDLDGKLIRVMRGVWHVQVTRR